MYASRLLAGRTRVRLPRDGGRPRPHFITEPDAAARLVAAELAAELGARARAAGLPGADEAVAMLKTRRLWSDEQEAALEKARRDAEDLRAAVFERRSRPGEREPVRRNLRACEARLSELTTARNLFYHQTVEGVVAAARLRAIVAAGLTTAAGRPVWRTPDRALADRSDLLDAAVLAYLSARPSTAQLREVARTDPWRGVWVSREGAGGPVFGRTPNDLSEDQLALLHWTRLFEAAREAEDGPGEYADDDDVVDGWVAARAKTDAANSRARGLSAVTKNEKVANAPHVIVFTDAFAEATTGEVTAESYQQAADAIMAMNSPAAAAAMRRRFDLVGQFGEVCESRMPDSLQARR